MEYLRFTPGDDSARLANLITCYRDVFGDAPWNEWTRCSQPDCQAHWGKTAAPIHSGHCGLPTQEYWPAARVEHDIRRELATPGASCLVAVEEDAVAGFCWGYPLNVSGVNDHLALGTIASALQDMGCHNQAVYLDEIGVLARWRQHGIGKHLFAAWLDAYRRAGFSTILLRTLSEPPSVAYLWFKQAGYLDITDYGDHDKRVIMARHLG